MDEMNGNKILLKHQKKLQGVTFMSTHCRGQIIVVIIIIIIINRQKLKQAKEKETTSFDRIINYYFHRVRLYFDQTSF